MNLVTINRKIDKIKLKRENIQKAIVAVKLFKYDCGTQDVLDAVRTLSRADKLLYKELHKLKQAANDVHSKQLSSETRPQ